MAVDAMHPPPAVHSMIVYFQHVSGSRETFLGMVPIGKQKGLTHHVA
jgi:hypothetical protein